MKKRSCCISKTLQHDEIIECDRQATTAPQRVIRQGLVCMDDKNDYAHARWMADLLGVQPDGHILEIGFGNGANIKLLLQRASRGTVTGVEISETAIEMAS